MFIYEDFMGEVDRSAAAKRFLEKGQKNPKDALWSFLDEKYKIGCDLRRPFEQRWLINLSFLAGKQYVFYNTSAQVIQYLLPRQGKIWVVDNILLPRYQRQISRLIRNQPIMSVVPESTDEEDIEAAKVGDKLLKHLWRQLQFKKSLRQLGGWIYSCGNGFLDDRWNPMKGPTRLDTKTNELKYLGDVDVGVWSPLEILVPAAGLGDTDLHSFPWLIKAKYRSLDWFKKTFPKRGGEVDSEERPLAAPDVSFVLGQTASMETGKLDGAVCKELYVQPCSDFPRGKFITGAGGVILQQSDFPFNEFNLEQFKDIEVPGIFWGMATVESAIWLQKIRNKTLGNIVEFNKNIAKGKLLAPRGSRMEALPDDSFGQVIYFTPRLGYKPEWMRLQSLPRTYELAMQYVQESMMQLYSQHEVSVGTNKSDIRSGEMVQLLLEQDDQGNIPTHAIFEESLEAVMKRVLRRIQKGYSSERMLKIQGSDGEFEIVSFKGADLRNNTDVSVKKESSIPGSRVAKQAQVLQRFEKGLYGDPADPEVRRHIMTMLDDAVVQDIYGDTFLDEKNSKLENKAMMSQPGVTYLVNSYDFHPLHVKEHNRFRKLREYQQMKVKNRKLFLMLEATFENHIAMHVKFIMEAQANAARAEEGKGGR